MIALGKHIGLTTLRLILPWKTLVVLTLALLAAACAKVGAPQPPLKRIPPPMEALALAQEGGELVVTARLPKTNLDGSAITGFGAVEVTGLLLPAGTPLDESSWQPRGLIFLQGKELATLKPGTMFATRVSLATALGGVDGTAALSLRYCNERGHWSTHTPVATTPVGRIAATVTLRAGMDKHAIRLRWDPPEANFDGSKPAQLDGFIIERKATEAGPVEEAGRTGAGQTSFAHGNFQFDRQYLYAIASFRNLDGVTIRSGRSAWVSVDTKDIYPPDIPVNLAAVTEAGGVRIIWDPVTDPDLAGYFVFRDERIGLEPHLLLPAIIPFPSFLDTTTEPGKSYFYRVAAVDRHGNRSPLSAPVNSPFPTK